MFKNKLLYNMCTIFFLLYTRPLFAEEDLMCIDDSYESKIENYISGYYLKEEEKLYQSMIKEVSMCKTKNNEIVYHKFCRTDKLCLSSLRRYAASIFKYAIEFDLDPWLLAAVSLNESNYDAFTVGGVGEKGIFQLHPKSPWGKKSKFVSDKRYNKLCKSRIGHCQWEVIGIASETLRAHLDIFKRQERALTVYNTGKALPIRKTYVNAVMNKRRRLLNGNKEISRCD